MAGTLLCLFVFNLDCGRIGLGFRRSNGNYMFGRVGGHGHRLIGYKFPALVPFTQRLYFCFYSPWDLRLSA